MSDVDVKSFATEGDRDIHILYGSQSGNSEGLADKWKREATKYGLNPTVHDMDGFDINTSHVVEFDFYNGIFGGIATLGDTNKHLLVARCADNNTEVWWDGVSESSSGTIDPSTWNGFRLSDADGLTFETSFVGIIDDGGIDDAGVAKLWSGVQSVWGSFG